MSENGTPNSAAQDDAIQRRIAMNRTISLDWGQPSTWVIYGFGVIGLGMFGFLVAGFIINRILLGN
jgi:pyruvate/2-oxoglutarate dehydrogenase complex dihydrolipoamide dehydrogenase (E3) component